MLIEKFENIYIAYMQRIGIYGTENKKLMETFKMYIRQKNLFDENTTILGIALDDPSMIPTDQLRYRVGIVTNMVEENCELPIYKVPDGLYAIFEVSHNENEIYEFWNNIAKLTRNIPIDNNRPIIERYSSKKLSQHLCEFCIPIKELID